MREIQEALQKAEEYLKKTGIGDKAILVTEPHWVCI